MIRFYYYFLLYFLYCLLGYILECTYCSIKSKKIILNRGFLIGPYLPIYGTGAMIIAILLKKYLNDPIVLFVMASLLASVLEYITSYIMEKVFNARWWDYSDKKFNINGRICLENSCLFGIGSLFIMYILNPIFQKFLILFSDFLLILIGTIILVIYILDTILSITIIYKIRKNLTSIKKDATDQISEMVHKLLKNNFNLKLRLFDAFPNIKRHELYKKIVDNINLIGKQ